MKALPVEARTKNLGRTPPPTQVAICEWCGDTGQLVVYLRLSAQKPGESHPEFGPCPFCEIGFEQEFGGGGWTSGAPGEKPNPDGFWQGRDLVPQKMYPTGTQIVPPDKDQIRALGVQLGSV